jgi:hypothetical protein
MAQQTPVRQVELSRLLVDAPLAERLDALVKTTGAPGTWHRRRALEQYLARLDKRKPRSAA